VDTSQLASTTRLIGNTQYRTQYRLIFSYDYQDHEALVADI